MRSRLLLLGWLGLVLLLVQTPVLDPNDSTHAAQVRAYWASLQAHLPSCWRHARLPARSARTVPKASGVLGRAAEKVLRRKCPGAIPIPPEHPQKPSLKRIHLT